MTPIRIAFALVYVGVAWDDTSLLAVGRTNLSGEQAQIAKALPTPADEFMVSEDGNGWIGAAANSSRLAEQMTD